MEIKTTECTSVEQFWSVLTRFRKKSYPIFRGQADHQWLLLPKIFRLTNKPINAFNIEHQAILKFVHLCDEHNIEIPCDTMEFRKRVLQIEREALIIDARWPYEEFYPIISLMQHYGIGTRFLDWTKNPYIAAFFSTQGLPSDAEKIAVYCIYDTNVLSIGTGLALVRPPAHLNVHMKAQQGLFTVQRMNVDFKTAPEELSIDNAKHPLIHVNKVTLPRCAVHDLLCKCEDHEINELSLFPTYETLARRIQELIRPRI